MSDESNMGSEHRQPLFPHGLPNLNRLNYVSVSMSRATSKDFTEVLDEIARRLDRPVEFVDEDGYERSITAGAIDAEGMRLAWVECKSKQKPDGLVDVEFRLKALIDEKPAIDWVVETYNPYFGCAVGYMEWNDGRLVLIYREKHHTYACSFSSNGSVRREQITDFWMVGDDQITYISQRPDLVERLSLPELDRLGEMDADQARSAGVLPPNFEAVNARRKEAAKRIASPEWQERIRAKIETMHQRREREKGTSP